MQSLPSSNAANILVKAIGPHSITLFTAAIESWGPNQATVLWWQPSALNLFLIKKYYSFKISTSGLMMKDAK